MDLQELARQIDQVGLTHRKSEILALALPAIALHTKRVEDESMIALGASKIGGLPDLPLHLIWPVYSDRALEFIAQIALPDIAPFDTDNLLPHTGILYFFYISIYDDKPYEAGRYRILYYDGDPAQLVRQSRPATLEAVYSACAVELTKRLTLPSSDLLLSKIHLAGAHYTAHEETERESYWGLLESLHEQRESGPIVDNCFFGHPNPVQNDVFEEAYWAKHNPPRGEFLRETTYEDVQDWLLLFQMDSDDNANMLWGDVGRLYYCITRPALQERKFEEVVVVMQCT